MIKRWHDFDQSGWLCLHSLIPYFGPVVWVVVGCIPGTVGDNRFGPSPTARDLKSGDLNVWFWPILLKNSVVEITGFLFAICR